MIPPMPPGYHTDGCTLWPDGNWVTCCDAHDWAWQNGADFLQSNFELGACVANHGHLLMGIVMFLGVSTIGVVFYLKNTFWPRKPQLRSDKAS